LVPQGLGEGASPHKAPPIPPRAQGGVGLLAHPTRGRGEGVRATPLTPPGTWRRG